MTTDRAGALERALATRPGRVDVALEIGLPDADVRRRLLRLHARSVPLVADDAAVEQDDADEGPAREVTAEHLGRALDDRLDASQALTRSRLGGGGRAPA